MTRRTQCLVRGISLGLCIALGVGSSMAAPKPEPVEALTPAGEKLQARYTEQLTALKTEITKAVPAVGEQKKTAFQAARDAVAKATKEAATTQANLGKVNSGKGLVEHAKGKWIGGAEKGIAQAEAALKKATTEAEREAAKKDLTNWPGSFWVLGEIHMRRQTTRRSAQRRAPCTEDCPTIVPAGQRPSDWCAKAVASIASAVSPRSCSRSSVAWQPGSKP